ncbi:Translation initiation factor eIF-2B subunit beta [Kappamyces sp. JEL0680]|nr:Translation initiation factor eIF-2B subunit beta [Kappamyces sp. JEL0680]
MPALPFGREIESQVELLVGKLKRRQVSGSQEVTIETAKLLRNVIAGSRWNDLESIIAIVKGVQERLAIAQPVEFSSENTARRVLRIIHEEKLEMDRGVREEGDEVPSFRESMKNFVIQGISEILDEIETATGHISSQALEHIHSNEIIMTIGYSKLTLNFLKEAARFRKFQVILAEDAPL